MTDRNINGNTDTTLDAILSDLAAIKDDAGEAIHGGNKTAARRARVALTQIQKDIQAFRVYELLPITKN